ncbi:protein jag [Kineococcus rhizosphaerae]|uniref:SpoIIIJ-associated protein n=1 Tax=Kineococcus rhizosphaerae TaxID=559628 RepID=A0A2T0QYJ0_9ACTN|nr:R3H domain-containing nucleic acid-binding protein [Kineococcus rhizosphaerae]PRY11439.1 spoIIIJ-associated protein [Kineococcus rhizosphaerae]
MNDTTETVESTPVDETADAAPAEEPRRKGSAKSRLEEEGDIAADYLEELLDIIDLDGDIDIDIENGRASVAIVADEAGTPALSRLVGPGGEVLEALQELTRLAVQAQTGDRTRLMLDVAGHRSTKRGSLVRLANEVVARVKASGTAERLDPMPAFERKVVHDAVAAAGLGSESEGEEPKRRVVVLPTAAVSDDEGAQAENE